MTKVTFIDENGKETTLELAAGEVLYNACESKGLKLPAGCLAGSCGACRIEVVSDPAALEDASVVEQGTVNDICNRVDRPELAARGQVRLSCRAKIKSDLTFKSFS